MMMMVSQFWLQLLLSHHHAALWQDSSRPSRPESGGADGSQRPYRHTWSHFYTYFHCGVCVSSHGRRSHTGALKLLFSHQQYSLLRMTLSSVCATDKSVASDETCLPQIGLERHGYNCADLRHNRWAPTVWWRQHREGNRSRANSRPHIPFIQNDNCTDMVYHGWQRSCV